MAQVELRETGGETLVFNFYPTPKIKINFSKSLDYDDIPFQRLPQAYDAFSQTNTITISGKAGKQNASQSATGSGLSLKKVKDIMHGWMSYQNDGTLTIGAEKAYTLRIKHPDPDNYDSPDYSDFEVVVQSMWFDAQALHWDFSVTFREIDEIQVI